MVDSLPAVWAAAGEIPMQAIAVATKQAITLAGFGREFLLNIRLLKKKRVVSCGREPNQF
jgi:hypothetical protein